MTTRIGVVSDTHCPEYMERLPDRLFEVLAGVDLIVHTGDIGDQSTITALERVAPVHAVRGDHDRALGDLPLSREIEVEGRRIALVHGNRSHFIEEPQTLLWTLSLGYFHPHPGLPAALKRRFPAADVIVFGHTHRPFEARIGGTLIFNAGAVHQWNRVTTARRLEERPGWFEWSWLQVARHIRESPPPSVGILRLERDSIAATVIAL